MKVLQVKALVFSGFVFLAGSGSGAALTLEDALAGLLLDHPRVKAATKGVAASREDIKRATSAFLPTITLKGDIGPEIIDSPGRRAASGGKVSSRTLTTSTLTVTQNIFNGFSETSAAKSAAINKLLTESILDSTSQKILLEGAATYIDVLRQFRLVELAKQNEETILIQLNLEDERVQKGAGIAVDVLQAKSRLQLAKERRVRFVGNLEDAISRYIQVFDEVPEIDKLITPMPAADLVPNSLDEAIDIALAENPAVLNSDSQIAAARQARQAARAELFPTIDVVGTVNYEKHNNGVIGSRRDMSVLLRANWELFSGLSARTSIAKAAFEYSASRDNHEFSVRKTVEGARIAWHGLKTARLRLALFENAVNIASEVFESRKILRAAGKETVINVLDAESDVSNARINFASASFDVREAVYTLLQSIGRMVMPELQASAEGAGDTLPR